MHTTVTATEARKNWFQLLRLAGKPGASVTITLEGSAPLKLMSQDEWEGWMETLEIMSDPELMADIRAAELETETIPLEEVERSWQARQRNVRSRPQAVGKKAVRKAATQRSR